ncbi:transcriptional regulator [Candidatus Shapirobacteria bacterium CG08_land_8_20_14_0_20_39_18]|uniref:Transcriptional regulator n=1 Tax=Candidatus Shapirobacteria bacterium CG08_land_8_20_14_0_20_39_18 TaxID=1974883 RepID=A0A2M6XCL5_9BACT|nr:MAG: transcriptional regulator [Candidatus Shapirobacteria bacterium CG08_land_8_20_14_0_20_39_18]PIY66465.1 MAG: transcriptional regulator [Candidatus Shapirobacteria bacterium CG_4_10_14_0_8_um_filter_39_15]PJE68445.1 MAG: transcriptional regulator [Candidatus Shapirobacteria bacterium CG10_big_fil_rev_8_21_14_0_10_38_8]
MSKTRKIKYYSAEELQKEWMKDPEFRRAYEDLEPEFQIARALIDARIKKKMTQAEIAKKAGTKQPVISRLEGAQGSPSLSLIKRIAQALDVRLVFRLEPR